MAWLPCALLATATCSAHAQLMPNDSDAWRDRCTQYLDAGSLPAPGPGVFAPTRYEELARERSSHNQHFVACNLYLSAAALQSAANNIQGVNNDTTMAKVERKMALGQKLSFADKLARGSAAMVAAATPALPPNSNEASAVNMIVLGGPSGMPGAGPGIPPGGPGMQPTMGGPAQPGAPGAMTLGMANPAPAPGGAGGMTLGGDPSQGAPGQPAGGGMTLGGDPTLAQGAAAQPLAGGMTLGGDAPQAPPAAMAPAGGMTPAMASGAPQGQPAGPQSGPAGGMTLSGPPAPMTAAGPGMAGGSSPAPGAPATASPRGRTSRGTNTAFGSPAGSAYASNTMQPGTSTQPGGPAAMAANNATTSSNNRYVSGRPAWAPPGAYPASAANNATANNNRPYAPGRPMAAPPGSIAANLPPVGRYSCHAGNAATVSGYFFILDRNHYAANQPGDSGMYSMAGNQLLVQSGPFQRSPASVRYAPDGPSHRPAIYVQPSGRAAMVCQQ